MRSEGEGLTQRARPVLRAVTFVSCCTTAAGTVILGTSRKTADRFTTTGSPSRLDPTLVCCPDPPGRRGPVTEPSLAAALRSCAAGYHARRGRLRVCSSLPAGRPDALIVLKRSASGSITREPKARRQVSRRCADKSDQDGAYGQFAGRRDESQPVRPARGPAGRPQRLPGTVSRVCREQQAVTMHDQEADRGTRGQRDEPAGG